MGWTVPQHCLSLQGFQLLCCHCGVKSLECKHALTHAHRCAHACAHTHAHTHMHAHTHTNTHTHKHTRLKRMKSDLIHITSLQSHQQPYGHLHSHSLPALPELKCILLFQYKQQTATLISISFRQIQTQHAFSSVIGLSWKLKAKKITWSVLLMYFSYESITNANSVSILTNRTSYPYKGICCTLGHGLELQSTYCVSVLMLNCNQQWFNMNYKQKWINMNNCNQKWFNMNNGLQQALFQYEQLPTTESDLIWTIAADGGSICTMSCSQQ